MEPGQRILIHFGVGWASFHLFYLSNFIYFYLFSLIFIDFLNFLDFHVFYILLLFFPSLPKRRLVPHFQNRSDSKMPTRRGNLRTEPFHFFSKGVQNRSFHPSDRNFYDFVTKNHIFWIFVDFCNFWKPRADIFQNFVDFGVRPKDFNTFWSPAKGF